MPGPLSRVARSPSAKRRLRLFSIVALAGVAALSWWSIAQEGASTARVLAAAASSAAVVAQAFLPRDARRRRRAPARPGAD
jgi:hypothetical protein